MATGTDLALPLLLARLYDEVLRRYNEALRTVGCTAEEWWVLTFLAREGGRPMHEIAEFAGLPKPTLTKVVDRMVAGNLAYRRVDVTDRRRVLVSCTVRGLETHARARGAVGAVEADLERLVGGAKLAGLRDALAEAASRLP
ncbi:MarR family winged helix-turn-helix transcriptional regulator [Actinomycetospora sp. NBC_00405]|uniref:MarR family winged helix-turn-helix transcriptional regulator n=1 Tax=Actinomycetospora sp. NBC_00405 TaxID=2975952 RepID=UPI002E1D8DEC